MLGSGKLGNMCPFYHLAWVTPGHIERGKARLRPGGTRVTYFHSRAGSFSRHQLVTRVYASPPRHVLGELNKPNPPVES